MANPEHVAKLLEEGVRAWNKWRKEHPEIRPDLCGADLEEANLKGANLRKANLKGANLHEAFLLAANLISANLDEADLSRAELRKANLRKATLRKALLAGTTLHAASLIKANLNGANFILANFGEADLSGASFSEADFSLADLSGVNLSGADLSEAKTGYTKFGNVDLSRAKGLDTIVHFGPSTIGIDTIYKSQGNIPEAFLKGAGVDDTFITYIRSLVGKAIEYYSCFISYSNKDEAFAKRLYADLQNNNVRCWFAPEDLRIGDKFWHRIDESIKVYDKLLVVLSQNSVDSEWVEREVMSALEKEKQQKKLVLFPVTVDEAFKQTDAPWTADIRRTRHVGDFRNWKSHNDYQKAFNRLLRDLKSGDQKMASHDGTTNGGQV